MFNEYWYSIDIILSWEIHFTIENIYCWGCCRKMKKDVSRKGSGVSVALSLLLLNFMVLIPSASSVKLSPGVPNNSPVLAEFDRFWFCIWISVTLNETFFSIFSRKECFKENGRQILSMRNLTIKVEYIRDVFTCKRTSV